MRLGSTAPNAREEKRERGGQTNADGFRTGSGPCLADEGVEMKLEPELVPQPLWGISAARLLHGRVAWKRIRNATLDAAGYQCSVCGDGGQQLHCNEQWCYDDGKAAARLVGFQIVCVRCHSVIHMGRSAKVGYLDDALAHWCRVDGISEVEARRMFERAIAVWRERSRKRWHVEVAPELLAIFPELGVLQRQG